MHEIVATAIVSIIASVGISAFIIIKITAEILKQATDMLMKEFEENHNDCMQFYKSINEMLKKIGL